MEKARAAGMPSVTLTALRNQGTKKSSLPLSFQNEGQKENTAEEITNNTLNFAVLQPNSHAVTVNRKESWSTHTHKNVPGSLAPK